MRNRPWAHEPTRFLRGAHDEGRWEMAIRTPSESLRPYLHGHIAGYDERTGAPVHRREFPGPFVVLIFELGPPIRPCDYGSTSRVSRHSGGFVAGLDERFAITEHDGFQQGIQVNLTPTIGTMNGACAS